MFAILAVLCFLFKLLSVRLGNVDLIVLGWLFIALHLVIPVAWPRRRP